MEKPWLAHYPAGVPECIDVDPQHSLATLYQRACEQYATRPAFSCQGHTLNFETLHRYSSAMGAYFQQALGLKKGDRIALMLPNVLQFPIAMMGALEAGLIVTNINPLYKARGIKHQLNDSGARVLVVLENFASEVEKILDETSVEHVIVTQLGDAYSPLKRWIVNAMVKHVKQMVPPWSIVSHLSFLEVLNEGLAMQFSPQTLCGKDIAYLQYTGATTGLAKGVVLTHGNLVANVLQCHAWVADSLSKGREIVITALPLYHIFSLMANCWMFVHLGGENVLIPNPRDIKSMVRTLKRTPFTALTGVNTLFNALLEHADFHQVDFSSLHLTLGGGMAVQTTVAKKWHALTKKPLCEAYGLTEASPAVTINPLNLEEYNGYIGLPIPSTEVSIRDAQGEAVVQGERGELWVKGPQVMKGYWNNAHATEEALTAEGWLKTGDVAVMNAQGMVKLVDRIKDMIIVSGFNVYPAEIEDVLSELDGVLEVAVIGVADQKTGEAVKACIVRKETHPLTEDDVKRYARAQLTGYKVPKVVAFYDALPKTPVGKVLRRALKEGEMTP